MINEKDLLIIAYLRRNSRESLTRMSHKTSIPVSTIFDRIQVQKRENVIKKHTALLDFARLGYNTKAHVMLKVERKDRDEVAEYLRKYENTNSLYKINNGFDLFLEVVFRHVKDLEDFLDELETKFKIREKKVFYVIDDLKREGFLSDPDTISLTKAQDKGAG